jgi:flagellum-specific peptidoglycan hydrolase FlgJ
VLAQAEARGFANALQRAGYATDPDYAAKLARTIDAVAALRLG